MSDFYLAFIPEQTEKVSEVLIDIGKAMLGASLAVAIVDVNSLLVMARSCFIGLILVHSGLQLLK